MWQVLRRYQGVSSAAHDATEAQKEAAERARADKAFRHNQRVIALNEWKEHQVDPTPPSLAVPYDRYVFEKMLRLAAPDVSGTSESSTEIQRRALANLIQLIFEKPHNVHHLLKEPALITSLVSTCQDPDEDVRRATCVLLRLLAQDRKGAEFLFNTRMDEPTQDAQINAIAIAKNNAFSAAAASSSVSSSADETTAAAVRRRLADVGEVVRCLLACCMDRSSVVATEALKAMSVFHGFADTPEYTFALMRAHCVPCYAELLKAFSYTAAVAAKSLASHAQACAAALNCLRLVTNAKEAFLEVLKADVLDASLRIVTDFDLSCEETANAPEVAKLLCAALSVVTELVLYTAGSNAAAQRGKKRKLPTLLPCARLCREHPDPAVRTAAAGALATLCVSEGGKAAALEEGGIIDRVKESVRDEPHRDVVSSMCRIVCLLSELPAARKQLVELADRLKEVAGLAAEAKDSSLEEGATRAVNLVLWVPGQE